MNSLGSWAIHASMLVQIQGTLSEDVVNYLELRVMQYLC